jgi:predicted Zn-dependent peptidase
VPPVPDGKLARGTGDGRRELVDRVPSARVYDIHRCAPLGSPDYYAVEVLAAVLGSDQRQGGRLHRALVHEQQLAQSAGATVWGLVAGAGLLLSTATARAGVAAEQLEKATRAVVAGLVDAPVTEDELERAISLLTAELLGHLGGVGGRADLLSQHASLFGDAGLVNDILPRLAAVTAADVLRVATDLLDPDGRATVVFRPEADAA